MPADSIEKAMLGTQHRPYSIEARIGMADAYQEQGYPDLALGDAYLALLLLDEVRDESGEWHEDALEDMRRSILAEDEEAHSAEHQLDEAEDEEFTLTPAEADWLQKQEIKVYSHLVSNSFAIGCVRTGYEFLERGIQAVSDESKSILLEVISHQIEQLDPNQVRWLSDYQQHSGNLDDLPARAMVRRDLYSWNQHEANRYSNTSISLLNNMLSNVAPKLEVRVTELPDLSVKDSESASPATTSAQAKTIRQLGVFAKEDLQPGDLVLDELSLLTATSRLNDTFCDACSKALPTRASKGQTDEVEPTTCPDCVETVFCSERCLNLATESYHPAVCDAGVSNIAKDADKYQAADDLYTLLVLRALAMAQTQGVHPLDLPEVAYIWGDFSPPRPEGESKDPSSKWLDAPKTLPFSFRSNIELPLQFLLSLPGANPFLSTTSSSLSNDTPSEDEVVETSSFHSLWTINTLYAKFRGTASARQGPDGKPEVAAVHPLWCLANHSCNPNVKWEWDGGMKFWIRTQIERVVWHKAANVGPEILQEGADNLSLNESNARQTKAGVGKGDEIFGHYCDVSLPVQERREWAAGALGGMCQCERCRWEE